MSRKSKQLSWRKKSLRAAFGRKLHIEPLEQRQLLDAAPLPLPTPNIPAMPKLQPTVITAGGQRLLLNYFNNAYNAAHNPAAEVQVTFDSNSDTLVCNKPGWYVENFPLTQINGLQGDSADTVANLVFGAQHATDVQNWYIMTPVDATHPAPAEPPAPNGPAPITPTNLTAPVNGSYFHVLVVDNNPNNAGPATSDPSYYYNTLLSGGNTLGAYLTDVTQANNQVKVDSNVYSTITAAVNALTSSAYYSSTSQSVTQPTIILITPGTTSYEESPNLSTLNGTSTSPLILEGVPDASGNLPVWGDFTQITGWQQVTGTSGVYKSALSVNPSLYLENVVEHTNSIVNGDLTPGSGNQQTLIEALAAQRPPGRRDDLSVFQRRIREQPARHVVAVNLCPGASHGPALQCNLDHGEHDLGRRGSGLPGLRLHGRRRRGQQRLLGLDLGVGAAGQQRLELARA